MYGKSCTLGFENRSKVCPCTLQPISYVSKWSGLAWTGIHPDSTVYNGQRQVAGLGQRQATRLLSGRGGVVVGVGVNRHNRGGFLQAKSQLGRSSYHVNLAFCGHGGQLNVSGGRLDGLILGQETSSINQTGWHGSTEHSATVDKNVFMTVWVGDIFSTLSWPRAFNVFISGQVGGHKVCMEAWEAQDRPDWEETYHKLHSTARTLLKSKHQAFSSLGPWEGEKENRLHSKSVFPRQLKKKSCWDYQSKDFLEGVAVITVRSLTSFFLIWEGLNKMKLKQCQCTVEVHIQ